MDQKSMIDWNKEKQALREGIRRNWWKASVGQHKILFLSNGEKYVTSFDNKEIQKVRFDIEVNTQQFSWGVVLGETVNSLYGQIALFAAANGGLDGKMINLIVKGKGKETSYTVLEALPLMTPKEEKV